MAKHIGGAVAEVHTVDEAANRLRIGRNQAYEAIRRGEIPSIRIGNSYRVPRSAIDRMLRGELGAPTS